jgi:Kef-type K+ transport system membrane component KefB
VPFLGFALFLAVAMSVTAFPVLARIVEEHGLTRTRLGTLALSSAAVDDITAWWLLAVVAAETRGHGLARAAVTVLLSVAFAAVMLLVVRPLLARRPPTGTVSIACGLLLSALATDAIGIHPIFGAFLYGVVLPRRAAPLDRAAGRLRVVAVPVLLPLFFASAGLHARFGLLGVDLRQWAWCGLIVLVAVVGKGFGGTLAARAVGAPRREALALGTLLNCRGVTELVVLAVGLSLGAISPTGYTMLVAMTVVSTAMTSPALDRLGFGLRRRVSARPAAD